MNGNVKFTLLPGCPEKIQQFFWECERRLRDRAGYAASGLPIVTPARIQFIMPGLKPAHQLGRYLAGRNSPLGEIIDDCINAKDGQIVSFDAVEVLAWIVANKWAKAEEVLS